ncbi:MAG: DNA mismatch repair protein MutS [Fluviicola sp.]|nr:DNA mismatch repair protein MutS [Fluviicola sp.]
MQAPHFYTANIQKGKIELSRLKKVIFQFAMLRLTIFFAIIGFAYLFWGSASAVILVVAIGITLFLLFVSKFTDAKNEREYFKKYVKINEMELQVLNGDLKGFKTGAQYVYENHYYNQDIDLFGEGSLFQHICRSETINGEKKLADWLNSNDINNIEEKQTIVKELSQKADWRQDYQITASIVEKDTSTEKILAWIKNYQAYVPAVFRILPSIFSALSALLLTLYFLDILPGMYLLFWFLLGLAITGKFVKKTTELYNNASQMQATFAQYSKLLASIEAEKFECNFLKKQQEKIKTEGENASKLLRNYTKAIDLLGQRNNLLLAMPFNGFLLWDLMSAYRVEKWLLNFKETVAHWFEVIEYFDAVNSFGNYAFNNQESIYPTLANDGISLSAKDLGHPLLQKEKLVANDISMKNEDFFIITGANMAGKSTFLRTVALNIVMANCGLPVAAKSFSYQPIKLISSMRTSDSLQNDESYFFSELKRLKFIVDEMKTDKYFIILDEILKGTNSKDKAEGSKKFIEKLVRSHSTGIVATHDLSLCTLSESLPQVKNHYFDAEIIDDELFFDYTFKEGVCQNMNASFLLKKMGIV